MFTFYYAERKQVQAHLVRLKLKGLRLKFFCLKLKFIAEFMVHFMLTTLVYRIPHGGTFTATTRDFCYKHC